MINPEDYEPDPDDLDRAQLAELAHLPWSAVAEALDEWLHRTNGIVQGHHNVGLFLDLLNEKGWRVVRDDTPPLEQLLPAPTE